MKIPVYKMPTNPATETPEPRTVGETHKSLPEESANKEISSTNIPYRGEGTTVEHGVIPDRDAEYYEDEFMKAERAATKPVVMPDPEETLTPFPVWITKNAPPPKERRHFLTGQLPYDTTVRQVIGADEYRVRLTLDVLSATADVYISEGQDNITLDGMIVRDSNSMPVVIENCQNSIYCASANGSGTLYWLAERVVPL